MFLDLEVIGDTNLMNIAMAFKETVIESAASTDTVAKRVKHYAGDND